MPGDTYTPPQHHQESTVFDDGNVLEFRKARDDLRPQSEIEAARAVQSAYGREAPVEREQTPVEIVEWKTAKLIEARSEGMAA